MNHVSIRMYDVGFGDCFFLRFPAKPNQRAKKMLIDCGSVAKNANTMEKVVNSIITLARMDEPDDVPRIDLLVISHRHKDHIDGFRFDELWAEVVIKEIWMPWTEEKDDPTAMALRDSQTRMAAGLAEAASLAGDDAMAMAAELALANEQAMNVLWDGFAGEPKRKYFETTPGVLAQSVIPGVRFRALGPVRDLEALKVQDDHEQSYLAGLSAFTDHLSADQDSPFINAVPMLTPAQVKKSAPYLALGQPIIQFLSDRAEQTGTGFAELLDKQINNTSLVLVIEIGEARLLFPGDAQWGSWQTILEKPELAKHLENLSFYKVSHHASHNGTPVDFVEQFLKKSVKKPKVAISSMKTGRWPSIPRQPLVTVLEGFASGVVRTDDPQDEGTWAKAGEDEFASFVEMIIPC